MAFSSPRANSHSRREPGPRRTSIFVCAKSTPEQAAASKPCRASLAACTATPPPGCRALSSAMEVLKSRAGRRPRASKRATSALSRAPRTSEGSTTNSCRGRMPFRLYTSNAPPSKSSTAFRRKREPHVRQSSMWLPSGVALSARSTSGNAPSRSSLSSSALTPGSSEPTTRRQAASKARVALPVLTQYALKCSLKKEAASQSCPSASRGLMVGAGIQSKKLSADPNPVGPATRLGIKREKKKAASPNAVSEAASRAAANTSADSNAGQQRWPNRLFGGPCMDG
mmetsp:Transcript_961/g.3411  ORF Transcript_961/g.3411 Transcript_961/m.3411 type:complete len:284 (+) Transcript_961:828-1679(+)